MEHTLNLGRYRQLLEKEKNLNVKNKSLMFENKSEFLKLNNANSENTEILLNNFNENELSTFSIDLIAIEFGSLISKISGLADTVREFGPESSVSDKGFMEYIKNCYFKMLALRSH